MRLNFSQTAEPTRCFALEISEFPSRRSANNSSQRAMDSSVLILSTPALSQFFSGVSTMKVDQSASKRYACRVNQPHSVSLKSNVKPFSFFLVPSQLNRLRQTGKFALNSSLY